MGIMMRSVNLICMLVGMFALQLKFVDHCNLSRLIAFHYNTIIVIPWFKCDFVNYYYHYYYFKDCH